MADSTSPDFARQDGPPVTPRTLALVIGVTPQFVRDEIREGELPAYQVGHGERKQWRIHWCHARTYLIRIGVLTTDGRPTTGF